MNTSQLIANKALHVAAAEAALKAFTVVQLEGDLGKQLLVATRGPVTKQFESVTDLRTFLASQADPREVNHGE
jgi:hypothetical protein